MKRCRKRIQQVAQDSQSTVLILGKSGTGKDLAAREIHDQSGRKSKPFVAIDCPTISHQLFESELFGHEKGAFTDARSRKMGRIEMAHSGTLFLDEIGDLPSPLQAKLLRFLETNQFHRVGGLRPLSVDVRVISSTNRDLRQLVDQDAFREDLYYRLKVAEIHMSDLKNRMEDILPLAEHFLREFNLSKGKNRIFDDVDHKRLVEHEWPGNVRELRHAVESFTIFGELPLPAQNSGGDATPYKEARRIAVRRFERQFFKRKLLKHSGNVTHVAQDVCLSREEMSRKLKRLGLVAEKFRCPGQ